MGRLLIDKSDPDRVNEEEEPVSKKDFGRNLGDPLLSDCKSLNATLDLDEKACFFGIQRPLGVRYAWAMAVASCNKAGIGLAPSGMMVVGVNRRMVGWMT